MDHTGPFLRIKVKITRMEWQPVQSIEKKRSSKDEIPSPNGSKQSKSESDSDSDESLKKWIKKIKTGHKKKISVKRSKSSSSSSEEDSDYDKPEPKSKKLKVAIKKLSTKKGRKDKNKEPEEVRKWWNEAPREDGVKWTSLHHKGPVFAPPYVRLPKIIRFRYNGSSMTLSKQAEEVAGFYSRFIEHDYANNKIFHKNFFNDWRNVMNKEEKKIITELKKCDFSEINAYYKQKREERKALSKEEKQNLREKNEEITKEFGTCILDGHKERIGNFRIEPPGLFIGRGEHPKIGMLKTRVMPEDVTINCSEGSKIPKPPSGHHWKEIVHDNTVSWLACWTDNIQGKLKYIMLNQTSKIKGQNDYMKYETARKLGQEKIDNIRQDYKNDLKSKETEIKQRAVAIYLIDKLALRVGNEKDKDQADTVGCCNLRHEHIGLLKDQFVEFDFLGKDSIRYQKKVKVEKCVHESLRSFLGDKEKGDDLFDKNKLNPQILNKYLNDQMEGLTAKVFRTYNASHTLQQKLDELTPKHGTVSKKLQAYTKANREVAFFCNHKRAVPKSHERLVKKLQQQIESKTSEIKELKKNLNKPEISKKHQNQLKRSEAKLKKLKINLKDKEEGKEIALGTSKLNYLDPRITVAWCKKYDVPIEKVYNKGQRAKFRWAIEMADKKYRFD